MSERTGTYRVALGLTAVLLSALVLGFASPFLVDMSLPILTAASSPDDCTVVMRGCHGERFSINDRWEGFYDLVHNRGACTEELRPIDAIDYTAGWSAGQCQIEASMPADCETQFSPEMCTSISDILNGTYR